MLLQATKNLTKFVQDIDPCAETFIRASVNHKGVVDCLFYLNQGNGREIFSKLIDCKTIEIVDRGSKDFIDLNGLFDGYAVEIAFSRTK